MTLYNRAGKEVEDEKYALCKEENDGYYVKNFRGSLFDPVGIYSNKGKETTWRKCSQRCFDLYLKYLSKREGYILRLAERELIDV